MQACSIVEDKSEHIVVQYKDYVDLYVVSFQEGSWGVQVFDCKNELWSPYHLICENNFWVLVWYIEVVMGLTCIMPMLEIIVHELIKFVESHETFVCDFAWKL